jgi:chaperone required for assembly of F1-ATPase
LTIPGTGRKPTVAFIQTEDGFGIALDDQPASTPMRRALAVPSKSLAEAVAAEWEAQGDEIVPRTMPLTQLAVTALDRVEDRREEVIDELAAYGSTELLCYRAEHPAELARREHEAWQPLLDWLALRFDAPLAVTSGIVHKPQNPVTLAALRAAIAARSSWELAALALAAHATGSIVLALALAEERIDAEAAWSLSLMDELYQAELWGVDPLAVARRESIRNDIVAAQEFLRLLRAS